MQTNAANGSAIYGFKKFRNMQRITQQLLTGPWVRNAISDKPKGVPPHEVLGGEHEVGTAQPRPRIANERKDEILFPPPIHLGCFGGPSHQSGRHFDELVRLAPRGTDLTLYCADVLRERLQNGGRGGLEQANVNEFVFV